MTQEETKALREYFDWKEKYGRKEAIKALFNKSQWEDDVTWFYWLKSLICLLLRRTNGDYLNSIPAVFWDMHQGVESGYDWEACWVGEGIFKNWRVVLISDSSY